MRVTVSCLEQAAQTMATPLHSFHAVAFVENLVVKELAPAFPEAKRTPHELWYTTPAGGTVFIYPFNGEPDGSPLRATARPARSACSGCGDQPIDPAPRR